MIRRQKKQKIQLLSIAILIGSFVIAVAIIISTVAYVVLSQKQNITDPKEVYQNIGYINVHESPMLGNKNAPVTVIEYTDFDCPICKVATDEILPGLKKDYIATGKIKFIFKSLPIEALHPNAFKKTEAAFCAREQGGDQAFFDYYDSLYNKFGFSLNLESELVNIAQENHLQIPQFEKCLESHTFRKRINDEIVEANLIGSLGTPTWLIGKSDGNGMKDTIEINGLIDYASFRTIIDKQL